MKRYILAILLPGAVLTLTSCATWDTEPTTNIYIDRTLPAPASSSLESSLAADRQPPEKPLQPLGSTLSEPGSPLPASGELPYSGRAASQDNSGDGFVRAHRHGGRVGDDWEDLSGRNEWGGLGSRHEMGGRGDWDGWRGWSGGLLWDREGR